MDSIVSLSALGIALVPVVIAVTAVLRTSFGITTRFVPLTALAVGIAGSFLIPDATVMLTVLQGILIGLSAAGLYSSVKTTVS